MSDEERKVRVKPLFLIPPGAMKTRDLLRIEHECGVLIVECKDPDAVRLVEPPVDADMDGQARAALTLARMIILHEGHINTTFNKGELIKFFTQTLINSPQPKTVPHVKSK